MAQRMKLIYGVPFGSSISQEYRDVLDQFHVKELDTGSSYVSLTLPINYSITNEFQPGGEEGIGNTGIASRYIIHTKTKGYQTGTQDYKGIIESAAESIRRLQVESVNMAGPKYSVID